MDFEEYQTIRNPNCSCFLLGASLVPGFNCQNNFRVDIFNSHSPEQRVSNFYFIVLYPTFLYLNLIGQTLRLQIITWPVLIWIKHGESMKVCSKHPAVCHNSIIGQLWLPLGDK